MGWAGAQGGGGPLGVLSLQRLVDRLFVRVVCVPNDTRRYDNHRQQGLVARLLSLQKGAGMSVGRRQGWEGEREREAELVHLYGTLAQGAGEAARLLEGCGEEEGGGGVVGPDDALLTVAQVG